MSPGDANDTKDTPDSGAASHIGRSVTIDHAAKLLNVSRRTIYNRISDGRLRTVRTIGGSQRVLMTSLEELRSTLTRRPSRRTIGKNLRQLVSAAETSRQN